MDRHFELGDGDPLLHCATTSFMVGINAYLGSTISVTIINISFIVGS